jgi:conjugative relaxase-like TrwC/TraI family protein
MLSFASLGSAGGASSYYAADNYYSVEEQTEHSQWGGAGAQELGLSGRVKSADFEKILSGKLTNGEHVGRKGDGHRAGVDLTFSAPKSVSLLALVGGDKRIITAQKDAVRATMMWVEKNLSEGRLVRKGETKIVKTGNLVYALFEHDTSRKLDPQLHTHAVIANVTKRPDGSWRVLHNDALIKNNTLIGSIYHAELRVRLEKLGYATELRGKHGAFEIRGVSRDMVEAFSARRAEIVAIAERIGKSSPAAMEAIAERTRGGAKLSPEPEAVRKAWAALANERGYDLAGLVAAAHAARPEAGLMQRIRDSGEALVGRISAIFAPPPEALMAGADGIKRGPALASAYAVTVGVRHLSERNAAFTPLELIKNALDFGQKGVTVTTVEARIAALVDCGTLIVGGEGHDARMTSKEMRTIEETIITGVRAGQGAAPPITPANRAVESVQEASDKSGGHELNSGQLASAVAIVSGDDRVLLVQGIAGAGKTSMLAAAARVIEAEGRPVLGLAFQNKMVDALQREAKIDAMTVHRFVAEHRGQIDGSVRGGKTASTLKGGVLLLDEASMIPNRQMLDVMRIAEVLGVAKMVLVGDARQIDPIEAGRPFALMQEAGIPVVGMDENLRQRDAELKAVVAFAADGKPRAALEMLGERLVESEHPVQAAAQAWLGLDPATREKTVLLTSGRAGRAVLTELVREGLVSEGTLGATELRLPTLENLNLTREELRHVPNYREGLILDVHRDHAKQHLTCGQYRVAGVDPERGNVTVARVGGNGYQGFAPGDLHPQGTGLSLCNPQEIGIRVGDTLAWTANDHKRALWNSARLTVTDIEQGQIALRDTVGETVTLAQGDPMRTRLTHAVALNMHMAQGMTADRAIATMDSRERLLTSEKLFYVLGSRARDELTLFVDDHAKLADRLENNSGANSAAADVPDKHWTAERERFDPVTGEIERPPDARNVDAALSDAHQLLGIDRPPDIAPQRLADLSQHEIAAMDNKTFDAIVSRDPPETTRDLGMEM